MIDAQGPAETRCRSAAHERWRVDEAFGRGARGSGRVLLCASVALLTALVVFLGCGSDDSGSGSGTYQLGAILSLTGAAADLGQHELDAMEVAVEEINEAGGVHGRELSLEVIDDGTDPNRGVSAFNDLARNEQNLAIFGATLGTITLAISSLSQQQGVPLLPPNTTYEVTRQGNEYLFRVAPPAQVEIEAIVQLAEDRGYERVAIMHGTDEYSAQAAELLEDSELNIVANESFDPDSTNLTAQLAKVQQADPDALMLFGNSPVVGIAILNAGQLGLAELPIISGVGAQNAGNIEAAGDSPALGNWLVVGVVDPANPLPRQVEPLELLEPEVDYPIDIFSAIGYDGVHIFAEALEQAGPDADRDSVRDALESVGFAGLGGDYQYSADNHDGLGTESIIFLEVKGGEFVTASDT